MAFVMMTLGLKVARNVGTDSVEPVLRVNCAGRVFGGTSDMWASNEEIVEVGVESGVCAR